LENSSRRRFLKNSAWAGGAAIVGAAGLNRISPWIWRESLPLEPNGSFWAGSQPPQNPKLAEDLIVDVVVLGGGFTGLSSAYFVRSISPHKSVAVLEARGCGNGASGRNGAMVLTMTADRYMNFSTDPSMDKRIYDLTAENIRFLSKLSAAIGIDCDLDTQGALQVFDSQADLKATQDYVARARSLGLPVELWDSRRIAGAVGTEAYLGGFFDPSGGQVHPMKLVHVFKAAAQAAGVKIYENTAVVSIEEGREHVLRTGEGRTVRARSLVLATNAFTPGLGYMRNSILPVKEYVAVTRSFSEQELLEIGWCERIPFNDSRTEVYYLGLTRDRRIHIGGGTPRYSFNNRPGSSGDRDSHVRQLGRELARIYPKLSGVGFAMSWDGVIDWSLDASPSVGSTGRYKNVFYGIGYSGHGVNLTSVFGRIIAELEAGRAEPWSGYPFVNNRLYYVPNEPFRWLAAEAGISFYGLGES
jgi:gamma-glutamylputrescine oxidase